MSNMSYCRFRNTLEDLRDCYDNMNDAHTDDRRARVALLKLCKQIADDYGDMVEVWEDEAKRKIAV